MAMLTKKRLEDTVNFSELLSSGQQRRRQEQQQQQQQQQQNVCITLEEETRPDGTVVRRSTIAQKPKVSKIWMKNSTSKSEFVCIRQVGAAKWSGKCVLGLRLSYFPGNFISRESGHVLGFNS
jgi:phosphoribosyl-dephospho-CoA transferase